MRLNFDIWGKPQKPEVFICQPDGSIINGLQVHDFTGDFNFNEISEIEFTAPYKYTDIMGAEIVSPVYDLLTEFRKIKVEGIGMFEICDPSVDIDPIHEEKTVRCKSSEYEFTRRRVSLEINLGTETSTDGVVFYNPQDKPHSLMHLVLEKFPHWTIKYVDGSLINKERSFELDDEDVYTVLNQKIANTFRCIFVFDTLNNGIYIYDEEHCGEDTDIFVSAENLAESIGYSWSIDDIKTVMRVYGKDDLNIREVNLGMEYIMDLSYYATPEYMGDSLYAKYMDYLKLQEEKRPQYSELLTQINALFDQMYELENRHPDVENSVDWTKYGLILLKEKQKAYELVLQTFVNDGYDKHVEEYQETWNLIEQIKAEIKVRESEIQSIQDQMDAVQKQMDAIADEVDMSNNFTEDEIYYLSRFMSETDYQDDCFLETEDESESSITETKQALLDEALKELHNISRPSYDFSMNMANILALAEFRDKVDKFKLGNYILIGIREDIILKSRLLSIHINFDDYSDFSVDFGGLFKATDKVNKFEDALEQVKTTMSTVNNNSSYWQKAADISGSVEEMMKEGLNTALVEIKGNGQQDVVWDHTGIHLRMKNAETGEYDPRETWITSSGIYFSNDNMYSLKAMLGEFKVGDVVKYGLIAEAVIAGDIIGSTIHSGNLGGDTGWYITDGAIYSGNKNAFDSPEKGIFMGTQELNFYDKFLLDKTGKLTINVDNLAISGQNIDDKINDAVAGVSVDMTQQEIIDTLGEGFYIVDGRAYVKASAMVSGILKSKNYSGSTTSDGYSSTGTLIDLDNGRIKTPNFYISSSGDAVFGGRLSAASGSFSGDLDAAGGTFTGTLQGVDGTFSGRLSAATGTFSGDLQAAGGTFTGTLNGVDGTFSGTLSAATGSFGNFYTDVRGIFMNSGYLVFGSAYSEYYIDSSGEATLSELHVYRNVVMGEVVQGSVGVTYVTSGYLRPTQTYTDEQYGDAPALGHPDHYWGNLYIGNIKGGQANFSRYCYAPSWVATSSVDSKKNIKKEITSLEKVLYSDVYSYELINELIPGEKYGFVIGEDYNVTPELVEQHVDTGNPDNSYVGINLYSSIALLYRALQDENNKVDSLLDSHVDTVQTVQLLKSITEDLTNRIMFVESKLLN